MAVIRLELEVDSEVYPELHAALERVGSLASRGERLRQLAATGLVWETVRIHGASVTQIPGASAPPAAASSDWIGSKSAARPAEKPQKPQKPPKPAAAPKAGPRSDFVDLALNAAPPRADAGAAPDSRVQDLDLGIPPLHIPMLIDVVSAPPSGLRALPPLTRMQEASLPRPADPVAFGEDTPEPADEPAEDAGAPPSASSLAHKSGVRSRLLRMKEMGLFKNG